MLMLLLSGCATDKVTGSNAPVCDGLSVYVDEHADALILDGGPKSRVTGVKLIARYDGACL